MDPARPRPVATVLLQPMLRPRDAFAITIGIVVGAGIFRMPSLVAGASANEMVMLGAWLIGGLLSIIGALCYAELATTYPQAGGDYSYLRLAYGPRVAFLYAWARLAVIQSGSIALLAYMAGDYLARIFAWPLSPSAYAAAVVGTLTAINWLGIRQGAAAQLWLTVMEVAGVVLIIVAGLLFAPGDTAIAVPGAGESAMGLVLVFVLLTFGGWNEAVYVTAEVRDPQRWIPRILVLSLIAISLLYLLINIAYLQVLGMGGMAGSDAVAAELMAHAFGDQGALLMGGIVVAAALTSANATLITGARSAYAAGRDFPALAFIGRWDQRSGSPRMAMLVQGGVALLLVGLGAFAIDGFRLAVEYTAPVFWLFFLLAGISLFVLRRRDPAAERPFRVPLYPLLPLVFCLTCAYLLYSSLAYTGLGALVGVAVLVTGAALLLYLGPSDPTDRESFR